MKILVGYVPADYSGVESFKALGECTFERYDRAFLDEHIHSFDMIVPHQFERLDRAYIEKATNLRLVSTPSTGTDHIDIAYLADKGIRLVTLNDDRDFINEIHSTAEMSWLLTLAAVRRFPQLLRRVQEERSWVNADLRGYELAGSTLGIIGFGRLGMRVAQYANAFGMEVIAYDTDPDVFAGVDTATSVGLDELLSRSDVVSLHAKLNDTSRHILNADAIARMKSTAIIVNTARGALIDSQAVLDALAQDALRGIATDVVSDEFLATELPTDPLVEASFVDDRIIVTPHMGGATHTAHAKVFNKIAELSATALEEMNR